MQRVGMELLDALQARDDIEVTPIVLRTTGWGMVVKAVPFYVSTFLRIAWLALRGKTDVVLFSAIASASLGILLKPILSIRGIPLATICHGHDVIMDVKAHQLLVRLIFRQFDAVLPVSQSTGAQCLQRGLPKHKLHVVHNGIDVSRFETNKKLGDRRQNLRSAFPAQFAGLQNNAFVICATGRQVRRKGHAWFVEYVMPLLPDRVHFWLGGDGHERTAIELAAKRAGVDARVQRLGLLSDARLAALYRGSDIFVMPNIKVPGDVEGFGVVILEAGLNGLPVIGARLEGIVDAIEEGKNGHLVESGNPRAFADAINRCLNDSGALQESRSVAEMFTRETFSWKTATDQYLAIFRSLKNLSEEVS